MNRTVEDYIDELREFQRRSTNYIPTAVNNVPKNGANNNDYSPYRGRLIFNITHSQGTYPVTNALITIYDGDTIIQAVTTDESGKSPNITLDAFDSRFSESPGNDLRNITKYYNAKIEADGFVSVMIQNIPIYENITTLQKYDMLFKTAADNNNMQVINLPDNQSL